MKGSARVCRHRQQQRAPPPRQRAAAAQHKHSTHSTHAFTRVRTSNHCAFKTGSCSTVLTSSAPCSGGLEYIGRATPLTWLSTRAASSGLSHTCWFVVGLVWFRVFVCARWWATPQGERRRAAASGGEKNKTRKQKNNNKQTKDSRSRARRRAGRTARGFSRSSARPRWRCRRRQSGAARRRRGRSLRSRTLGTPCRTPASGPSPSSAARSAPTARASGRRRSGCARTLVFFVVAVAVRGRFERRTQYTAPHSTPLKHTVQQKDAARRRRRDVLHQAREVEAARRGVVVPVQLLRHARVRPDRVVVAPRRRGDVHRALFFFKRWF